MLSLLPFLVIYFSHSFSLLIFLEISLLYLFVPSISLPHFHHLTFLISQPLNSFPLYSSLATHIYIYTQVYSFPIYFLIILASFLSSWFRFP